MRCFMFGVDLVDGAGDGRSQSRRSEDGRASFAGALMPGGYWIVKIEKLYS
jgi:hypothetical protein